VSRPTTASASAFERALHDEVDRLAGNHLSATKAETGKLAALGELVHQVVGDAEDAGGLCDG